MSHSTRDLTPETDSPATSDPSWSTTSDLIKRPHTIAHYASISKNGRNTLRHQMGLTIDQFQEFVIAIQQAISIHLDVSRPWTRQDEEAKNRYIDSVVAKWPQSSRYEANWAIVAYTCKHAKLGSRCSRSPAKASPAKASPAKASPAKASPAKASTAKAKPMTASTLVETNEPILPALHLAERAPPKDDRALPSAKPRLSDKRTRIHKDAQPRERTRNPLPSSAGDARPKKVIKYIGAPPPRLLKRMAEIPRSRNQSGSSPNTLDSVARLTTPFRVRSHANAASGSNSRSTDSDPEVRSFLSSLKPSCIDFLHRFTQYGIHDHKALVDLATSPHGLYLFLDGLGETSFKTILLRRALVKLGER